MNNTGTRGHVHFLIDQLLPAQLVAIESLLSVMLNVVEQPSTNANLDDNDVSEEEAQAIRSSEDWFEKNGGQGVPMDEVLADFGLSLKDFPLEKLGS